MSTGIRPGRCIFGPGFRWLAVAAAGLAFATGASAAGRCRDAVNDPDVAAVLTQLEASVDPCGESAQILNVVREFRRCAGRGYRICRDARSERNFIEPGVRAAGIPTTITWNPELRTELERGCGGHAHRPVLRDPVASLLHEVVHAVQDCHGLDPTQHELEAVRMENIYRRARGLCQRTRYGDEHLPASMSVACAPGNCRCAPIETRFLTAANDDLDPASSALISEAAGDLAAPAPFPAEPH